jgi:hypothetical protein
MRASARMAAACGFSATLSPEREVGSAVPERITNHLTPLRESLRKEHHPLLRIDARAGGRRGLFCAVTGRDPLEKLLTRDGVRLAKMLERSTPGCARVLFSSC